MRDGLGMTKRPEAVSQPLSSAAPQPRAFIGISGYDYKPWRGVFYPDGLPAHELAQLIEHLGERGIALRVHLARHPGL